MRAYEKLGAHCARDPRDESQGGTHFAVWAPNVPPRWRVIGDFSGWQRTTGTRSRRAPIPPASGRRRFRKSAPVPCTSTTSSRAARRRGRQADPVRLPRGTAAAHRLGGVGPGLPPGTMRRGCAQRAHCQRARRAMVDLRAAPGLVAAQARRRQPLAQLPRARARSSADYATRAGLHARGAAAGDGASVLRLLGLPGHRLLRADRALRHAAGLHVPGRSPAPARHRRHPRLGAIALPAPTSTASRASTARTCTSTPTRARAFIRSGTAPSSTTAAPRCATSCVSSALFWLDALPHRRPARGCGRLDAVPGLRAPRTASGFPNRFGGRENLDAVEFLQARSTLRVYRDHPDTQTIAEESDRVADGVAPTYLGGLGFGLKWNMGWMHDTLRLLPAGPAAPQVTTTTALTFSLWYAFTENFVLPLSHDEVVHGKGSLIGKMPGRRVAAVRQPAAAVRLHVDPPGQEAAVHGRRVRRSGASGSTRRASSGTC